jgi:hypothetical protein
MTEQEFDRRRAAICAEFDINFAAAKNATYDAKWPDDWRERERAILEPAEAKKTASIEALELEYYGEERIAATSIEELFRTA